MSNRIFNLKKYNILRMQSQLILKGRLTYSRPSNAGYFHYFVALRLYKSNFCHVSPETRQLFKTIFQTVTFYNCRRDIVF